MILPWAMVLSLLRMCAANVLYLLWGHFEWSSLMFFRLRSVGSIPWAINSLSLASSAAYHLLLGFFWLLFRGMIYEGMSR